MRPWSSGPWPALEVGPFLRSIYRRSLRREMMVYGDLEADNVTRQALLGNEWSTEVVSVSSLTLREL